MERINVQHLPDSKRLEVESQNHLSGHSGLTTRHDDEDETDEASAVTCYVDDLVD